MEMHSQHEKYMARALELADLGKGNVSSNPMVGAVIELNERIIGEGYFQKFGGSHAEVNAVNAVKDQSSLSGATIYVTLEPCSFHGKTPPCSDLLIKHRFKKVVVAARDPHPRVSGNGLEMLKKAGIEVIEGVMEKEAKFQNRRFFKFHQTGRPYVILKWAQSRDGFIAGPKGETMKISNNSSHMLSHKWRTEEDAILVGRNTVQMDDPQLTSRLFSGKNPTRVVIDPALKLNSSLKVFDDQALTLVYNQNQNEVKNGVEFIKLAKDSFLTDMLENLGKRGIQSVIVEGGSKTLSSFIKSDLWDEARIFTSLKLLNAGIKAPEFNGEIDRTETIFDDTLAHYFNGN